jgi:hypothetical protein
MLFRDPQGAGTDSQEEELMKTLVFACGASYPPLRPGQNPFDCNHRAMDGSVEMVVGATKTMPPKLADGRPAPCAGYCLKPGRHVREQEAYEGSELVWITICRARLYEDGVDITPPLVGKCPHCVEQKAYIAACRRTARSGQPVPDRGVFREQYRNKIGAKQKSSSNGARQPVVPISTVPSETASA